MDRGFSLRLSSRPAIEGFLFAASVNGQASVSSAPQ